MIIKLTNAVKDFEGKTFLLNSDVIISVYEAKDADGNLGVFIFGQTDKTWQVKETIEQIAELLS